MRSKAVTIGTTPTLIAAGGSTMNPRSVAIQVPAAGQTVYIGGDDVSTTNGFAVAVGGHISVDLTGDEVYGVVAATTQAVRLLEENG
jgi:hypothetical protein